MSKLSLLPPDDLPAGKISKEDGIRIRVYPPFGKGAPFEIDVNEISAYRDWL